MLILANQFRLASKLGSQANILRFPTFFRELKVRQAFGGSDSKCETWKIETLLRNPYQKI
jgi:hypothetical protein